MPQHKSAKKRVRQTEKRRVINLMRRSRLKSAIKKVRTAENSETAQAALVEAVSLLDRMALKGIVHRNKAANLKSKLTRGVNAMQPAAS